MIFKTRLVQKTLAWIEPYTVAQRCYFFALLLFIVQIFSFDELELPGTVAFMLVFIGFSGELLELFQKVWETTIGKSIIIITYATLANIALAFAALQINLITGIEPSPFIFTLGFTTLVFAPFWIGVTSIMLLAMGIVILNVWILLSLLLKMLGFEIKVHWKDKKFPILSLILRLIFLPIMIVGISIVLTPYLIQSTDDKNQFTIFNPSTENTEQVYFSFGASNDGLDTEELQQIADRHRALRKIIADFIFYFEAYPYSSCQKANEQHSVVIDENAILLISKNPEAKYGYDFSVAPCIRGIKPSEESKVSPQ